MQTTLQEQYLYNWESMQLEHPQPSKVIVSVWYLVLVILILYMVTQLCIHNGCLSLGFYACYSSA